MNTEILLVCLPSNMIKWQSRAVSKLQKHFIKARSLHKPHSIPNLTGNSVNYSVLEQEIPSATNTQKTSPDAPPATHAATFQLTRFLFHFCAKTIGKYIIQFLVGVFLFHLSSRVTDFQPCSEDIFSLNFHVRKTDLQSLKSVLFLKSFCSSLPLWLCSPIYV